MIRGQVRGSRNDASWGSSPEQVESEPSLPLPKALMDASYAPPTVHKSDLFFSGPPAPPPIPPNHPLSHHTSYSAAKPRTPPNPHRSRTAPPPTAPPTYLPPPPPPPHLNGSDVLSPTDQDELQAVLQLSKSESEKQTLFMEKLSSQEEEELARALEESMRGSESSTPGAGPSRPTVPIHSQPPVPCSSSCEGEPKSEPVIRSSPPSTHTSLLDDEALARQLAAEEEQEDSRRRDSARLSGENQQHSLEDDEAFARRLALEEEADDKSDSNPQPVLSPPPLPPTYMDSVSTHASTDSSSLSVQSSLLRSDSSASSTSYVSSAESLPSRPLQPVRASSEDINGLSKPTASSSSLPSLKEQLEAERSMSAINVNQFVDKELLQGVSIGFYDPVVQEQPQAMAGVMPNIISLPYGKSPPLHLQTTSWRHLLKLMARLSGTRIEPTPQATQRNEDLHLRTVIQFVRPHYSSPTWRTIVWFTIDQDSERPLMRRNPTGDVDILPYSYSQMKLPPLLRDGSDSPLSKTYTIPSTHTVPYPILPISFPNLTIYLQAALDESRRYMNDSSSGMRKFAKMLQSCYPDEFDSGDRVVERSGMSGLFKKVIGRGGKSNKKGRGGTNEEMYDLVTPFVPDEWG